MSNIEKVGIIDVGGGFRGIYAAGIFDRCMDEALTFDVCIGVSAGSANTVSFLANQKGRIHKFLTEYAFRKEWMGFHIWLKTGSYVNLPYMYSTLSNHDGEYPLDYQKIAENPSGLVIVATDAKTGMPKYFEKSNLQQDHYEICMASSTLPFVNKPYGIDGVLYYDGALGDPVPVKKAFEMGCEKIVLILTKPVNVPRQQGHDKRIAKAIQKKYPKAAEALLRRAENYNKGVELARKYENEGKALIIAPDDTCGIDTIRRDKAAMERLYQKGYQDAQRIKQFIYKG
ncbi:MAG: patatin family protein [Clostridiales bacterium]|nr:patatin family protein [Clostridiales bacterium]